MVNIKINNIILLSMMTGRKVFSSSRIKAFCL